MRLKTRHWFLLSLVLFGAAAWFWHLGDQRVARRPSAVATNAVSATNAATGQPFRLQVTNYLADASVLPLLATVTTNVPNGPPAGLVAYRLSNTKLPLNELARSDRALLLRNVLLNTANPARPEIPAHLRAQGDPGAYIVQSRGAITASFRAWLTGAGAEIISYVPNNAFLVRADSGVLAGIRGSSWVQAVEPLEPYYKFDSLLLPLAVERQFSAYEFLNVVSFPRQAAAVRAQLERLGAQIEGAPQTTVFGDVLKVKAPANALAALAQIREVQLISVHVPKRLANDLSRVKIRVSTNQPITRPPESHYGAPTAADHLTGLNVLLGVNDSGVDDSHPDFTGRIDPGSYAPDLDGHGTHVLGTLLGDGAASPLAPTNAMGSTNAAIFSGVAPLATVFVQDYRGPDANLQLETALRKIRISNNSWGYPINDYDIFAASYDAAVRDSSPGETGEQEVAYVFAAGNNGGGDSQGLNGIPGSILSPATAKNVISVGGSDLPRFIDNRVYRNPCFDVTNITATSTSVVTVCQTNQPWLPMTDSSSQVAPFSARGNVGIGLEGPNGRFKPDVIAPGGMVVSARSIDFQEESNSLSTAVYRYNFVPAPFNVTNLFALNIPGNALSVTILALSNSTAQIHPGLLIGADIDAVPTTTIGPSPVTLVPPTLRPGTMFYTVVNAFDSNTVVFDLVVLLTVTNDVGNYYEELKALNEPLKPYYRYEAGTSMAAPQISGLLALFQEFLAKGSRVTSASPALLKALVINGARSLSPSYNLDTHAVVNHQGWGLVSLSNSIPSGLDPDGTTGPMRFFDQDLTNSLITGASNTYTITVPPEARSYPLRVSLVWTDPPGNPLTGVKLVNDLNLTVDGLGTSVAVSGTNSVTNSSALLYLGNNFSPGSDFVEPFVVSTTDTNLPAVTNLTQVVGDARDYVNNVENIYIRPPLAASYNVVVKGHRVNVNSVNSHSNYIGQDYALVISSGNVAPSNNVNLAVTGPVAFASDNSNRIASLVRANTNANSAALFNQRVGANSALIVSTNGTTNQWCFFLYTNSLNNVVKTGQYVAIFTFFAPELSRPRVREADIDLYVCADQHSATAEKLLLLDPTEVGLAAKSTGRSGTELVLFTNAVPDEVFYIGVKSEDQQAAQFSIIAISSDKAFSARDSSNNIVASVFPAPIPDGTPDAPGGTNLFALVVERDVLVQRVIVTNILFHEEAGDLIGILHHADPTDGSDAAVTLNNHRTWNGWDTSIYDDSDEGDLTNSVPPTIPPDGPGSLRNFVGQQAFGLWQYDISDNALFHTGLVQELTLVISPASTNRNRPVDLYGTLPPGRWRYAAFPVTADVTNIHACVTYEGGGTGPLELYLRRGDFPDRVFYDKALLDILFPGGCLDLGLNDNPPVSPGRYYVGLYNAGPDDVPYHLTVDLERGLNANRILTLEQTNSVFFIDDATTNSFLTVTNRGLVASVEVDLRIDHPRVADLSVHLTGPTGVRTLLAENRGYDTPHGYGWTVSNIVVTNFGARLFDDGFEDPRFNVSTVVSTNPPGPITSGWRVGEGNTLLIVDNPDPDHGFVAHSGRASLDVGNFAPGTVWTNLVLQTNRTYQLSFAYARNPDSSNSVITLTPYVPEAEVTLSNLFSGTTTLQAQVRDDALNTWGDRTNLAWKVTNFIFRPTGVTNRLQFRGTNVNGEIDPAGVLFDTVRVDEIEVITNKILYATFTDDPAKAIWPIKFAPTPFGETNFTGTNIFLGGFERTNFTNVAIFPFANRLITTQAFDGWLVTSNHVFVQTNVALGYSDTNVLFLRTGVVERVLPTVVGREYTLRFATRTARRSLYSTGVDRDDVPLLPGEIDSHYLVSSNDFTVSSNRPFVQWTNAMEFTWFDQTNGATRWIGIDPSNHLAASILGTTAYTYRVLFNLRGIQTNAILSGWLAGDDKILATRLNGRDVGLAVGPPATNGFVFFTLSSGFTNGQNQLEFLLDNGDNGSGTSAHGFRVQFAPGALETPVVTFDDLPAPGAPSSFMPVPNDFAGLQWNYFAAVDGAAQFPVAWVTPRNVVINTNGLGVAASFFSARPFNFNAAQLTALLVDGLPLRVEGLLRGAVVYDTTNYLTTAGPTLVNFDYQGVDEVRFTTEFGDLFTMDNLFLDPGVAPRIAASVGQVKLVGCYTNFFSALSDQWRTETVTFVARATNTVLEFTGVTPGVWLDDVWLRETGRKYYLPEEPLTPFIAQQAAGDWKLELWDNRLGADVSTANLIAWRLHLTYVRTNPPFVLLTNTLPFKAGVGPGNQSYFAFDVSCDSAEVTNVLRSLNPLYALNLIFNQGTFPLTGAFGDYPLLINVLDETNILSVGSYPLLNRGRYFLAVQNTNAVPVPFEIIAGFDTNCAAFSPGADLAVSKSLSFGPGGASFSWSASSSATFAVLYAEDPAGPWIELPAIISSATGEFSFTDDGTLTGGLPSHRFYRIRQR